MVQLAKSADGGLTWTSPVVAGDVSSRSATLQAVSVDANGKVNVVFVAADDRPVGTPQSAGVVYHEAYWTQSTNGGATFTTPLKISTANPIR